MLSKKNIILYLILTSYFIKIEMGILKILKIAIIWLKKRETIGEKMI